MSDRELGDNGRPLSRRELRERRLADEAAAARTPEPAAEPSSNGVFWTARDESVAPVEGAASPEGETSPEDATSPDGAAESANDTGVFDELFASSGAVSAPAAAAAAVASTSAASADAGVTEPESTESARTEPAAETKAFEFDSAPTDAAGAETSVVDEGVSAGGADAAAETEGIDDLSAAFDSLISGESDEAPVSNNETIALGTAESSNSGSSSDDDAALTVPIGAVAAAAAVGAAGSAATASAASAATDPSTQLLDTADEASAKPIASAKTTTKRVKLPRTTAQKIVGVFGEVLITGGVVVLLFIGWRLWWQNVALTSEQADSVSVLSDKWAAEPAAKEPVAPVDPAAPPVDYGVPTVMSAPAAGDDFAILYVPRFGDDYSRTIAGGIDPASVLNKGGAGHYQDSQMPGEVGNFAIAAHRDGWGSAFMNINEFQVGDAIYVETQDGWYTYRFRTLEYVTPFGVGVVEPVPQLPDAVAADRLITLTSCNPLYIASERIIAYGVFESWQPRSAGPPAEIAADVAKRGA